MMKYRYTYYVLLCLALVGLVSCEMKDELLDARYLLPE